MFRKATRQQSKLRMTIDGPAGSGKTFTALRFAHTLAGAGRIALIDTERGSASKYAGEAPDGIPWDFDTLELTQFSPEKYTEAIMAAGRGGYAVLVIDSLSHAWEGTGGALEIKQRAGESWSAWRHVTPIHNRMVDAILQSTCHVITTMRSRMEYVQEVDGTGRTVIRKVGLSPIQRPGMEYEFDVVADMDWSHILSVSKTRCPAITDMKVEKPGPDFLRPVVEWLFTGEAAPVQAQSGFFSNGSSPLSPQEQQVLTDAVMASVRTLPVITLDTLLAQYGPETIMAANGGLIPANDDEVAAIAALLAQVQ